MVSTIIFFSFYVHCSSSDEKLKNSNLSYPCYQTYLYYVTDYLKDGIFLCFNKLGIMYVYSGVMKEGKFTFLCVFSFVCQ